MIPLRDMALLCAEQGARDAVGLFGPWLPAKAEYARELAAVENGICRATRGCRKRARRNRRDAGRAAGEGSLCRNDAARKAMPRRHATAGVVISAPDILIGGKTRCDGKDCGGEIGGRGGAAGGGSGRRRSGRGDRCRGSR